MLKVWYVLREGIIYIVVSILFIPIYQNSEFAKNLIKNAKSIDVLIFMSFLIIINCIIKGLIFYAKEHKKNIK